MDLLALDDPVFVVELTPAALEACRAELDAASEGEGEGEGAGEEEPRALPDPPARPVRAVALRLADDEDPLLLPIAPTRDMAALDAAARLLRVAAVTGRPVAELATEHGDARLRRLYFRKRLPAFIYEGVPARVARRLPPPLRKTFAGPPRGASG